MSATDHFNLETGIPTTIEDIEPLEFGSVELQSYTRYRRMTGARDVGELEPRLAFGIGVDTQLEVATPLLLGRGVANGNGDIRVEPRPRNACLVGAAGLQLGLWGSTETP